MDVSKANLAGAVIALLDMVLCILIFIFRLMGQDKTEHWLGLIFIFTAIPILYLFITAGQYDRPAINIIQLAVVLVFIIAELLLDYVFKADFRHTRWMVITYATLFFAAMGGLTGIASLAGRAFSISAVVLFFVITFLAFYQRYKTGM
jgi:hypothetical protein